MGVNVRVGGAWVSARQVWVRSAGSWVGGLALWARVGGVWVPQVVPSATVSVSGSGNTGDNHNVAFSTLGGFDTEVQINGSPFYTGASSPQNWVPGGPGTYTFRARHTNAALTGPWGAGFPIVITGNGV